MKFSQLPLSVTLMITEKCNLKCKYCYEVFAGNMQAQTMSEDLMQRSIDFYTRKEVLDIHPEINWDFVGGEVFAEFDLLRKAFDYLIKRYVDLGLCPRKYLKTSLCTNATLLTPEAKAWCEDMRKRIAYFGIGISLDGCKEVHDSQRCNSFDRVMANFDWWREKFPECTIKGTISPATLGALYRNVRFFVEDLKLPQIYINPTFEGPWTRQDAETYSEQLISCAEYFLARPEYQVLKNSNLFMPLYVKVGKKRNWCGSGVYMRAITPDGTIYPCLRAATSRLHPIGHIDQGIDKQRLIPFYFYTKYNDDQECDNCQFSYHCPSCVMQWLEDTGDMYMRSKKLCEMTRVRYLVSQYYCDHTKEQIDWPGR